MSEDPYLITRMIPGVIKGIQSADTAACVKHYALNNQELDRGHVNAEVSERAVRVTFTVRNTGERAGAEVAQVYVGLADNDGTRPIKELKGFEKLFLAAGEARTLTVAVPLDSLCIWDNGWTLLLGDYTISVGSASDDIRLTGSVTLA